MKAITLEESFSKNVLKTESCWIWTSWGNGLGYGRMHNGKKLVYAHRYSYEKYIGHITPGLNVLHKCDNPSCVNPEHLYLGTQRNNIADAIERNRFCDGTKHPSSKIRTTDLTELRNQYRDFTSKWSKKLGVTGQTIRNALQVRTYRLSDLRVSGDSRIDSDGPK